MTCCDKDDDYDECVVGNARIIGGSHMVGLQIYDF
jgi:hypothetical protein